MTEKLRQASRIRPGELGLIVSLGSVLVISGFQSQVKDPCVLLVWTVGMLLLMLATGLQSLIVDRFDVDAGRRLLPVIPDFAFVGTIVGMGRADPSHAGPATKQQVVSPPPREVRMPRMSGTTSRGA